MYKIKNIYLLLEKIKSMMEVDGETNWIRSFNHAISICELSLSGQLSEDEANGKISSIIKGIYGGAGSFSDYVLWDDDKTTREEINKQFDELTNQLWRELGL